MGQPLQISNAERNNIDFKSTQVRKRVNKLCIIGNVAIELRSHAFNLSLNEYLEKNKTN